MTTDTMTEEQIQAALNEGHYQCVVEALTDGTLCWNPDDSREREPVHAIKAGERFWCWNFKALENNTYTHDYGNMAPIGVPVQTDATLKLVYVSGDSEDPVLWDTALDKSPNIT